MQAAVFDRQTDKKRLYFIDLLESIAIFFVLSYHGTNYSYGFLQDRGNVLFYFRYYLRTILSCCVPLFFFANGYLLLNRQFSLKKHIRKIIRLVILTYIWGTIDLFILMFIKNEFFSVKDFLIGVWTWKQGWINHLWYMQVLVIIYLFFPLIKTAYDNNRNAFYFFTIVVALFTFGNTALNLSASIAVHVIWGKNNFYSVNWFNGFNPFLGIYGYYSIVYFCVGGIADDLLEKLPFFKNTWVCIVTILISMFAQFVIGVVLSNIINSSWDVVWNGYDTIFALINVVCIYSLCTKYKGKNDLFRTAVILVSSNTLGIYFVHVLFNQMFIPYIKDVAIMSNIPGNILYTFVILLISLGTVLIIKKMPLLKRLVM